jgi:hypothetical protein
MPVSDREKGGRLVRLAWVKGVHTHFPEEPKASYTAPWEEISEWEREIVSSIYEQMRVFLQAGGLEKQPTSLLTREQGGRLVRLMWIIQVYRILPQPKEAYIQPWENMPAWEREIDSDIFVAIAREVKDEQGSQTVQARD